MATGFGQHQQHAEWLAEQGHPDISRAAVQRHSAALARRVENIDAATRKATAFIDATNDDHGALAEASLRLIQDKILELMMAGETLSPRDASLAANALAKAARASTAIQRERRKTLREAAQRAVAAGREHGIPRDFEGVMRRAIEGG